MIHNDDLGQLKEERQKIITSTALMNLDLFHLNSSRGAVYRSRVSVLVRHSLDLPDRIRL